MTREAIEQQSILETGQSIIIERGVEIRQRIKTIAHRFGWIAKFPAVLAATMLIKMKSQSAPGSYAEHQKEIYGNTLFSDSTDKFYKIRRKIADYAYHGGNSSVLDLATGAGWQARALTERGFGKVVAVDLVPERIEFCKAAHRGYPVEFRVMDGTSLDFADKSFDCSVVSAALHDMPTSAKRKAISELARVTRKRVVIFEPRTFRKGIMCMMYGAVGGLVDESMHFRDYIEDDMHKVLGGCGLRVVSEENVWMNCMSIMVCEFVD